MDGVLIDSEPLHFEVDERVLKTLRLNTPPHYLEKFVGFTNEAMWQVITSEYQVDRSIEEIIDLQVNTKIQYLNQRDYSPIDGVIDLLHELQAAKIPVGIASSSPRIFIEAVVNKLGISKYFTKWISSEEVERSKPEPDVFLKMAELLKTDSQSCLVIEDSKSGTVAAKNAGMKCIGYANKNSGNQDLSSADLIVNSIREIKYDRMVQLF